MRFLLYISKANIMRFWQVSSPVKEYIRRRITNTLFGYHRDAGVVKLIPLIVDAVFCECHIMPEVHRSVMVDHPYEVVHQWLYVTLHHSLLMA